MVWTVPLPCLWQRGYLPSSLYTLSPKRPWLGIATSFEKVSPNLTGFHPSVSRWIALCKEIISVYNLVMKTKSNCTICGTMLQGKQVKFCSLICKNRAHQSYPAQKQRGLTRKIEIVQSLGGRCSICGYNKNVAALTFHHAEGEKNFKLDVRSLSNRTSCRISSEVKKCILVCNNCHAELHNPTLDLDSLL